ncbi:Crp/Fnr family transcriptional regulator [Sphingomonas piscis]|uniref:Crp/Fnr family transcriptional regulator n=1 Tax=Sphingomonas piscis TaxID=2714943 RepID=UPI001FE92E8E|nr:Crp/Fnr family transcriptional regulator [Sphingomonas piscis]
MLDGWVSSSVRLRNGKRLIQKLHLPGDMLGTPSLTLPSAADTLTALTEGKTSFVSEVSLRKLFASNPKLSALFFMAAQLERITLMDALASAGRSSALENMAHLLLDLHGRLGALGAVSNDSFYLPITQEMIGDILGITAVHVNRVLREMSRGGLVKFEGRTMCLLNLQKLRARSPLPIRVPRSKLPWLPGAKAVA